MPLRCLMWDGRDSIHQMSFSFSQMDVLAFLLDGLLPVLLLLLPASLSEGVEGLEPEELSEFDELLAFFLRLLFFLSFLLAFPVPAPVLLLSRVCSVPRNHNMY